MLGCVLFVFAFDSWCNASECVIDNLQNYTERVKKCKDDGPLVSITLNIKEWSSQKIPQGLIDQTPMIRTIVVQKTIPSIADRDFCRWPNLTAIIASENNNTELGDKVLVECHKLEILTLSKNQINLIYDDALHGLSHLRELDLSSNQITALSANMLKPLINLKILRLSNNQIQAIEDDQFVANSHLEVLDISYNILHVITQNAFVKLTALKTLDVSVNPDLNAIYLEKLSSLTDLCVNNASLIQLHIPKSVVDLEANHNKISHLVIEDGSQLNELNMKNNSLQNLTALSPATQLTHLDVSKNNITQLDFTIFSKMRLTDIDASDNPIRTLNIDDLKGLNTLKKFSISLSRLDSEVLTKLTGECKRLKISLRDSTRNDNTHDISNIPQVMPEPNNNKNNNANNQIETSTTKADISSTSTSAPNTSPSSSYNQTAASKSIVPNTTSDPKDHLIQDIVKRVRKLEATHPTEDHGDIKSEVEDLRTTIVWIVVVFSIFVSFQLAIFITTNYGRWRHSFHNIFSHTHNGLSNSRRNQFGSIDPIMEEVL